MSMSYDRFGVLFYTNQHPELYLASIDKSLKKTDQCLHKEF